MKTTVQNALLIFIGTVSTAFAANGMEQGEHSILLYLFLGFGALIIVFQAIPGLMLFFSMIKGLLSPRELPAKKQEKTS